MMMHKLDTTSAKPHVNTLQLVTRSSAKSAQVLTHTIKLMLMLMVAVEQSLSGDHAFLITLWQYSVVPVAHPMLHLLLLDPA